MIELVSTVAKYVLVIVIYVFIYKIVQIIYTDIRMMMGRDSAAALLPHLKLMTPVSVKGGRSIAEIYPLMRPESLVGRSKKCLIMLPDPYVSSEHVRIDKVGDKFYAEDLESANGTLLNGKRLERRTELKDGDRISLGKIDLVFSEGGR
jgi:hypothetical protein